MTADEFYTQHTFECNGPDRVGGFSGLHATPPYTEKTISQCMMYPDCTCHAYRRAVDEWEDMDG